MAYDRPVIVDLFSGAGGLSLGFHAAGCRVLAGIDSDETASATFLANFSRLQPDSPPLVPQQGEGDLLELDLDEIALPGEVDIVVGGPPCQGFSRIGRAKLASLRDEPGYEDDPRNELYKGFLAAVGHWRPRAFVMENVPGMLSIGGQNVADEAGGDLADLGYSVGYSVLNSAWYGVPQYRERLFFVGVRNDLGVAPAMPESSHRVAAMPAGYTSQDNRADRTGYLPIIKHYELAVDHRRAAMEATGSHAALADLPPLTDHMTGASLPRGDFRHPISYDRPAHSPYAELMRGWPGLAEPAALEDHVIRRTKRDYETFGRMRPGDRYPQAMIVATDRVREKFAALMTSPADDGAEGAVVSHEVCARLSEEFETARSLGTAFKEWSPELIALVKDCFPPYPEDKFVDKWRKLVPHEPSWTVTAHLGKDSYSHIHYDGEQKRAISVREAARLQSFPDGFTFAGNMGDCYRQIGNAVPPLMAWHIAATLMRRLGLPTAAPHLVAPRFE